ncbi:MAG: substrate-binding domain-containing protein [Candidatus Eisenbacteria bacterium]
MSFLVYSWALPCYQRRLTVPTAEGACYDQTVSGHLSPACRRLFILLGLLVLPNGCSQPTPERQFRILSGSENKTLEPILQEFAKSKRVDLTMDYKGSVDVMLELQEPEFGYDAVWPANSLWISIGDTQHRVKHAKSIMTSPVVFGIREGLARQLGFTSRDVRVADILKAIEEKRLRFMMTSATQSNSGASAYIGFLYALLGNPDVISAADLEDPTLGPHIRALLAGVHRSSGSSGWLKDLFLEGSYDAMVNYEAVIIEANQELEERGREPLHVIYPIDGSCSPTRPSDSSSTTTRASNRSSSSCRTSSSRTGFRSSWWTPDGGPGSEDECKTPIPRSGRRPGGSNPTKSSPRSVCPPRRSSSRP